MFCNPKLYTVIVILIYIMISMMTLVADTASTTSKICNFFDDVDSSKLEIKCYNYKDTLRFTVPLTKDIRTIKFIRNNINALDSLSFPIRSKAIERLFLNSNNIKELPPGVLKSFPNLQILDLTDNSISEFHPDVFLENKQLREIYLDGNSFKTLNSIPFRRLVNLKKVSLEENHLEACKEETLETLNYFRKNDIDTDVPNLCVKINADSMNVENSTKLNIGAALTEETNFNINITSDSVNNLTFETLFLNKKYFYVFEAIVMISLSALGLSSFICIIRRHKRKNNRRTRTYSGDLLINEEESGYLTPRTPNTTPTYLEILAEIERTSIKSERFDSNKARDVESNSRLQPKIHKINHIYEELKLPHENRYEKICLQKN